MVNGYTLKNAIQRWSIERDVLAKQLEGAMWHFESDGAPPDVEKIAQRLAAAEDAVATLQCALQDYNLHVMVATPITSGPVALSYVIKRVGPAGRLEAIWRRACLDAGAERDHYDKRVRPREAGQILPKRSVEPSTAAGYHREAQRNATALRNVIAVGNGTEMDLTLPHGLFD